MTVKTPIQLMRGGFDFDAGRNRQYVPVPLKLRGHNPLIEGAMSAASDLHGAGIEIAGNNRDGGTTRHAVLIEGGSRYFPFGNWIVVYSYNEIDGTHDHEVYMAAEVQG